MTFTITITPDLIEQSASPIGLAIEAAKSGNLELLMLLLPRDIVIKPFAKATLETLAQIDYHESKTKRFINFNDSVISAIEDVEKKAKLAHEAVNQEKLKKTLCRYLADEKAFILAQFKKQQTALDKAALTEKESTLLAELIED